MLDFGPTLGLLSAITQHKRCFLSAIQVRVLASFLQLQLRLVVLIYHRPSPSLRCLIVIDTRFRTFLHLLRRCVFNIWRGRKNDSAFIVILKCIWRQVGFCALSSVLQSCISLYGQKIQRDKHFHDSSLFCSYTNFYHLK